MEAAARELGYTLPDEDLIYALDIGTRSVIGMLGYVDQGKVRILAVEKQPHEKRAMMDGQIEDIGQVSLAVDSVTRRLEKRAGRKLTKACVAAAGRALRTEHGQGVLELPAPGLISEEQIGQLEAAAVAQAEQALHSEEMDRRLFLVGYTVTQYKLDDYPMTNLLGHTGQRLEANVVATFLPSEVVDSLYVAMRKAGLEVASLTLEPIAALNAAIPADLRLLNLALVDIGAGTSDIAICREGSVVGYTMATVAGDEITEALMRAYLVDYHTAEQIKAEAGEKEEITFTDILGLPQTCTAEEVMQSVSAAAQTLVEQVAEQVLQLNGGPPSALFLAGGGSKLSSLREKMAQALGMEERRVALAGAHFKNGACSDTVTLEDPEYTTPLGIAISAGLGLISDSYRVFLNGKPAKLFRNGQITLLQLLMMNGYGYRDLLGRNGKSMLVYVDGRRMVFPGEPAVPAQLRINGAEVQPSVVVHAGDQIQFVPASSGKDRSLKAGEVMERLGGAQLTCCGVPISPDEELSAGAELETVVPMEEERKQEAAQQEEMIVEKEQQAVQPVPISEAVQQPARIPEVVQPVIPVSPSVERTAAEPCWFQLNGGRLVLPRKTDGSPYFLMDLLEHSGIDFEHLDRPVDLRVNGELGSFQQILRNGDQVEIKYAERK